MATGKVFYWLKLKKNFMTSDTVDFLMSQPEGANYVVLYQMLHLMTINTNGQLSRTIGDVIIPYDAKKIQRDTKWFTIDTINVALSLFMKLGLVYKDENGVLVMADHQELVGKATDYAEQKRVQRSIARPSAKELPERGQCPQERPQDVHDLVHTEIRDKSKESREESPEDREEPIDLPGPSISPEQETVCPLSDDNGCRTEVRRRDVQAVMEAWNTLGLAQLKRIAPDTERGKMLKRRIQDYGLDDVLRAIEEIRVSPFLMGRVEKFQITFDWFVRPNNFQKVLEGNYREREIAPSSVYAETDIQYRAAKTLGRLVSERTGLQKPGEETLQEWASQLDACVEENGTNFEDFSAVLHFSQEDAFWRQRIVDAASLRKHYRKLVAALAEEERAD